MIFTILGCFHKTDLLGNTLDHKSNNCVSHPSSFFLILGIQTTQLFESDSILVTFIYMYMYMYVLQ